MKQRLSQVTPLGWALVVITLAFVLAAVLTGSRTMQVASFVMGVVWLLIVGSAINPGRAVRRIPPVDDPPPPYP